MSPTAHLAQVQSEEDRIATQPGAGSQASSIATHAKRVEGIVSRCWCTPAGLEQAKAELLAIAEEAIMLRRFLCS